VDHPVKLIWPRKEDLRHDYNCPHYHDSITAALDSNGKLVARTNRVTCPSIYTRCDPAAVSEGLDIDTVEKPGLVLECGRSPSRIGERELGYVGLHERTSARGARPGYLPRPTPMSPALESRRAVIEGGATLVSPIHLEIIQLPYGAR
jgi:hypothetical protein